VQRDGREHRDGPQLVSCVVARVAPTAALFTLRSFAWCTGRGTAALTRASRRPLAPLLQCS
jgi:hypothetical protein